MERIRPAATAAAAAAGRISMQDDDSAGAAGLLRLRYRSFFVILVSFLLASSAAWFAWLDVQAIDLHCYETSPHNTAQDDKSVSTTTTTQSRLDGECLVRQITRVDLLHGAG